MKLKKALPSLILAASILICTACAQQSEIPDISDSLPGISESIHQESETERTDDFSADTEKTETEKGTETSETSETAADMYGSDEEQTVSETEKEITQNTVEAPETEITPASSTSTAATTAKTPETAAEVSSAAATPSTTSTTPPSTTSATTSSAASSTTSSTAAATTATTTTTTAAETENKETTLKVSTEMRSMTTAQIVKEMGLGINLGNTMESCGSWINSSGGVKAYETAWGSPVITEAMIKGYASCGFGVLRIPVAWSNLMGDNYTINPDYMARVKEITDWTLNSGMYAIINIHYDSGWWENFPTEKDECMKKYTRIWEQISEAFRDYGDKLMFESLNEEGGWDSMWNRYSGSNSGKAESYGLLNEINQRFVDTVRASGGNNSLRHLLIAGYNTDIDLTCDSAFVMPNDSVNRCAVSVHYYTPATFCILEEDASWGTAQPDWGSSSDIAELQKYMEMLKKNFVDKGIPVIIGEYGVAIKNKQPETIRLFLSSVAKEAYERDMCPVLWDITNLFYDRQKCGFVDGELLEQIMAAKK